MRHGYYRSPVRYSAPTFSLSNQQVGAIIGVSAVVGFTIISTLAINNLFKQYKRI